MAARIHRKHTDEVRERIKLTQLMNRWEAYALGELTDEEVSSNRFNAIKGLVNKVLPDVHHTEITGLDGKDLIPETVSDIELAKRIAFVLTQAKAE